MLQWTCVAVVLITLLAGVGAPCLAQAEEQTYRLYDGVTVYLNNAQGEAFDLSLAVRDLNLYEAGPRELLVKVYDPLGRLVVREIIPDDGVASGAYLPPFAGWDHEMWYYALCYSRGSQPMFRWSAFSEPGRLATLPQRTFTYPVPAGEAGVYRVLLVGTRDHYVTVNDSESLPRAVGGTALWLHGHGDMFRRSHVYVPRGTVSLHLGLAEFDQPVSRHFHLTAPDGAVLFDGPAQGGLADLRIPLDPAGKYDDQILLLEVSEGAGDFMVHLLLNNRIFGNGRGGSFAVLAPDEATAKAVQGGAIYHDGQVFWHGVQVRLHDWLKGLGEDAFVPRDPQGNVLQIVNVNTGPAGMQGPRLEGFPRREGFIPLNGPHERPPLSDRIMHDYPVLKDRGALNLALRDFAEGLSQVTTGDARATQGWNGNLAYTFGTYSWHYWRPAWRILQQSNAPAEAKALVREALILAGDRLGFAANIERVNGNAFGHVLMALRYCAQATGDALQQQRYLTYFQRFTSGGWGTGTGISRSGDLQEHFAHDHHYGSYFLSSFQAVVHDLGDVDFAQVLDRAQELYSYTWNPDLAANPWSSRTHHSIDSGHYRQAVGKQWKGEPGPDFTVSVNGGDEWFAARRANYYALTFHGRLAPTWLHHFFGTRLGYGGGILCQLTVPGRGTVLASTLQGSYGGGMQPANWRQFHLHSLVGQTKAGRPLVAADSDHGTGTLEGTTVRSSGEIRDRLLRVTRAYTFADDHILCEVDLSDSQYRPMFMGVGPDDTPAELYEMIPFVTGSKVTALAATGEALGELTAEPVQAQTVVVDRGGFGVRIELNAPHAVHRGPDQTVMIAVSPDLLPAAQPLTYRLRPYQE